MSETEPTSNFDVTEASGYTFEERVKMRNSNGYGGTQTKLPEGHLARRDTPARAKHVRALGAGE
jgi:hypothetical protein